VNHSSYTILWTARAQQMLESIGDRRIQEVIITKVEGLSQAPEQQGKPLIGKLMGFRSLRVASQRYRVVYRIERQKVLVIIVAIGIRRDGSKSDIYELAQKLFKVGILR